MPTTAGSRRVLYCTDTFPPQVNGVSVVTALSVAGLQARGWEVGVVGPSYPEPLTDAFGSSGIQPDWRVDVPSVALPVYPDVRVALPARHALGRAVEAFQPALVHCATEFMLGRKGQEAALARGVPAVSSYHTDFSRYARAYGVPWLGDAVARYLARFHRRSSRVYTPGEPARRELAALGVSQVEVWGRGVDVHLFRPGQRNAALRQAYGAGESLLLLHVGRLAAEKGVERILQGFEAARSRLGDAVRIRLIVAGTGPRERSLRARAGDDVTWLGNLDRTRMLPQLYASADGFLFASETETLGLVVLEAMASGLPVIATPAGGVADHLRDGQNGLAFAPGDIGGLAEAIVRLAASRELRERLGAGARHTAERLSWDRELDRLDESYRELLEGVPLAASA